MFSIRLLVLVTQKADLPGELLHLTDGFRQRHSKALRKKETEQPRQGCKAAYQDVRQGDRIASCGNTSVNSENNFN